MLRIISFSEFRSHTSPLFKKHKILKLQDHVALENCLLIHDFLNKKLPQSFNNYFKTTENIYSSISTRNSINGSIFVPYVKSTKYGLNSIKRKSILSWNNFAKSLNSNETNILSFSRSALKRYICEPGLVRSILVHEWYVTRENRKSRAMIYRSRNSV